MDNRLGFATRTPWRRIASAAVLAVAACGTLPAAECGGSVSLPAAFEVPRCYDHNPRILGVDFPTSEPWVGCWPRLSDPDHGHQACGRTLAVNGFEVCRIDQMIIDARRDWRPGDIALVGDSLVDALRITQTPILPRAHNFGLAGGEIDTMSYLLDEVFLAADSPCESPSSLFLLIGTDDIASFLCRGLHETDESAMQEYFWQRLDCLFDKLAALHAKWPACRIVVQTIPPATTGGVWFENGACPTYFTWQFNAVAPVVNEGIVDRVFAKDFDAVDLFPMFFDGVGGHPDYFLDNIHHNCTGVRMWLDELVPLAYQPLEIGTPLPVGSAMVPAAAPEFASFPNKSLEYHYAQLSLDQAHMAAPYRLEFGARSTIEGSCESVDWIGVYSPSMGKVLPTVDPSDPGSAPPFTGTLAKSFIAVAGFEPGAQDREIVAKAAEEVSFAGARGGYRTLSLAGKPLKAQGDLVGTCGTAAKGGAPLWSHWLAVEVPPGNRLSVEAPDGPTSIARVGIYSRMVGFDCGGSRLDRQNCDASAMHESAAAKPEVVYVLVNTTTATPAAEDALRMWLRPPATGRPRSGGGKR